MRLTAHFAVYSPPSPPPRPPPIPPGRKRIIRTIIVIQKLLVDVTSPAVNDVNSLLYCSPPYGRELPTTVKILISANNRCCWQRKRLFYGTLSIMVRACTKPTGPVRSAAEDIYLEVYNIYRVFKIVLSQNDLFRIRKKGRYALFVDPRREYGTFENAS